MLNVRLNEELDKKINQYSLDEDVSKSAIVKEALAEYFSRKEKAMSAFSLGVDLFGLEGSGNEQASTSYKKILKDKLNEKYSH